MLTYPQAVRYLLERGLLEGEAVVDGELKMIDLSRRNHNLAVITKRRAYLLKEAADGVRCEGIANEAAFYRWLSSSRPGNEEAGALVRLLPRCFGYDAARGLIILEFIRGARDIQQRHAHGRALPERVATRLGESLASLHLASRTAGATAVSLRPDDPPWALSIHKPEYSLIRESSEASIHMIRAIQQFKDFCARLDGVRRDWSPETLIHGDLKWENCLVAGRGKSTQVKIVDWELARIGDPGWDVGSVFSAYLRFWLLLVPISAGIPIERSLEFARHPLQSVQGALRAFWHSYARRMRFGPGDGERFLLRAVQYSSANLLRLCYEQLQTCFTLTADAVSALQLSFNILKAPERAAAELFGLSAGVPVP
ncbi:MAG TPA: aminoglycoside phosphotransferase family protein [Bryobacteraceae bacterium]|nr:aminoglycoside phosphotransferase family protein [Bryobacteraceae bacterium]